MIDNPDTFELSKLSRIASSISSRIMMILVLIYLFIKTLVNPTFTEYDSDLARLIPARINADWLDHLTGSFLLPNYVYPLDKTLHLPEVRFSLLFELGLYFPKEK